MAYAVCESEYLANMQKQELGRVWEWNSRMLDRDFPNGPVVENSHVSTRRQKSRVQSPGQEDPLEEGMATHCSILAWRIPRTEEPGGL